MLLKKLMDFVVEDQEPTGVIEGERRTKVSLIVRDQFVDVLIGRIASVITSKAANSYHFKTGQRDWPSGTENVLPCRLLWWQVGFGAPASRTTLEHMTVVQ